MSMTYDPRTPILLSPLNAILSRNYLPTITHPSQLTPSLLIALYESLIRARLPAIERTSKSSTSVQIRNIKLLLGAMVMSGWVDASVIDPVGIVEKEESCLMDLVEVLVEIGRDEYGLYVAANDGLEEQAATPIKKSATQMRRRRLESELSTISEGESRESEVSTTSFSTLRPIRDKADEILSRIHDLDTSLRPPSPSTTTISRATQTS